MKHVHSKLFALAATVASLAAQPAGAFTLTPIAGTTTSIMPGAVTFATFDGPTPVDPTYATVIGGMINGGTNPGAGGNWIAARTGVAPGAVSIQFFIPQTYFGLFWGSNGGAFDLIELYSAGTVVASFPGTGSLTSNFNSFWDIKAGPGQTFDRVQLNHTSAWFEADNFAVMAVPEPASWALMALGTLPLIGLARRRAQRG